MLETIYSFPKQQLGFLRVYDLLPGIDLFSAILLSRCLENGRVPLQYLHSQLMKYERTRTWQIENPEK